MRRLILQTTLIVFFIALTGCLTATSLAPKNIPNSLENPTEDNLVNPVDTNHIDEIDQGTDLGNPYNDGTDLGNPHIDGTDLGNPHSMRAVIGQMVAITHNGQPHHFGCNPENNDVKAVFINPFGDVITTRLNPDGSFRAHVKKDEAYEVQFEQNDEVCGRLAQGKKQSLPPSYVSILFEGTRDINLGKIKPTLGKLYKSTNDTVSETQIEAWEEYDLDANGYMDIFENGEIQFDDDECLITQVIPYDHSILPLKNGGVGVIRIFVNQAIKNFDRRQFTHLPHKPGINFQIKNTTYHGSTIKITVKNLALGDKNSFKIEPGLIACANGEKNQFPLEIKYRTVKGSGEIKPIKPKKDISQPVNIGPISPIGPIKPITS